jgi:hypothetical protein
MKKYSLPIFLTILLITGNVLCYLVNDRLMSLTTHVVILSLILINVYFKYKNK